MMDKLVKSEVYRFLFENSNDALLLTNPDGHVSARIRLHAKCFNDRKKRFAHWDDPAWLTCQTPDWHLRSRSARRKARFGQN